MLLVGQLIIAFQEFYSLVFIIIFASRVVDFIFISGCDQMACANHKEEIHLRIFRPKGLFVAELLNLELDFQEGICWPRQQMELGSKGSRWWLRNSSSNSHARASHSIGLRPKNREFYIESFALYIELNSWIEASLLHFEERRPRASYSKYRAFLNFLRKLNKHLIPRKYHSYGLRFSKF